MQKKAKGNLGMGMRWSSRMVSTAMICGVLGYFNLYGTSVLGLDVAVLGVLAVVCSIIDVITNFTIANYIDSVHPKAGKGRAYELFLIPGWIIIVLMFCIPSGISHMAQYVLYFLLSVLYGPICGTFMNCAEPVYFAHAFTDEDTRINVQAVYAIMTVIAFMIPALLLPILLGQFMEIPHGWPVMMILIGIPFLLLGLIRFFTIHEISDAVHEPQIAKVTLWESLKALFTNKYVVMVTLVNLTFQIANGVATIANTYYFTYVLGQIELLAAVSALSVLGAVFIPVYSKLTKRFGKGPVLKYSMLLVIIGYALRFFAMESFAMIMIGSFLVALGNMPLSMMINLMVLDCMDFGEWKSGQRLEAAIFAGTALGTTIGPNLGTALGGFILSLTGFVGTAAVQTAQALGGIRFSFSLFPAIVTVGTFLVLHFYDLDKRLPGIRQELKEHRDEMAED